MMRYHVHFSSQKCNQDFSFLRIPGKHILKMRSMRMEQVGETGCFVVKLYDSTTKWTQDH